MNTYRCPMHPQISQSHPGRCSICKMELVEKSELSKNIQPSWKDYLPLITIFSLILIVSWAICISKPTGFTLPTFIANVMTGFFITFSGFKLLDIKGFAQGYATYDLLAQKLFSYGYIYPFIELGFGLGMILLPTSKELLVAEIIVMVFSGIGVALKLAKKEKFQCACLGTFLKVPLTSITLIEDFGMAILALILLMT